MTAISALSSSRPLGALAVTAAACLSLYLYIRPALNYEPRAPPTAIARNRIDAKNAAHVGPPTKDVPYPYDVFPGGRDVDTPYGTIRVFEWGPENGDKVLLLHGIGTPCIALGDMAKRLVSRGHRVMLFDWFGRGYADAPTDLPYDERLYTTQILLVLASSPLAWTGSEAFHMVGYSLGGAIAAAFAAFYPNLLRSATLICPGGLIRTSHVSLRSRIIYSEGLFPENIMHRVIKQRLMPQHGPSADVPVEEEDDDAVDFDTVPLSKERPVPRVGDVMRWQLGGNDGLVPAYVDTLRRAPVYGQHDLLWKRLAQCLADRRGDQVPPGLPGGKILIVLGEKDPVAVKEEWMIDTKNVLGDGAADFHVLSGGHEIAIGKGEVIADLVTRSWGESVQNV